jgi:hypothetical protein
VWDDRTGLYGDRRPYVLHYFLEDDSVEILDINENNSGRDPFPVFLKRGPLPKVHITQLGLAPALGPLNVYPLMGSVHSSRLELARRCPPTWPRAVHLLRQQPRSVSCPAQQHVDMRRLQSKPKATGVTQKLRKEACYKPQDFRLGEYIDVHGRSFLLHDCDAFTSAWYRDALGYGDEELHSVDIRCAALRPQQLGAARLNNQQIQP